MSTMEGLKTKEEIKYGSSITFPPFPLDREVSFQVCPGLGQIYEDKPPPFPKEALWAWIPCFSSHKPKHYCP